MFTGIYKVNSLSMSCCLESYGPLFFLLFLQKPEVYAVNSVSLFGTLRESEQFIFNYPVIYVF